ncbi:M12 family metallo-peptidase [Dyadobacter sp. CY323]|uniref:M12 family metallo-peptidase n=1 Tax=Dyadobacter sp. CY323 TaxID=2907302 RepID=UPI001F1F658A|nr:M12 family metallo-peptidase [Dyadobacter sp. CY323]MCE6991019.1 M12 family metallo-peptidase [Dyadobacter sp. CY323]
MRQLLFAFFFLSFLNARAQQDLSSCGTKDNILPENIRAKMANLNISAGDNNARSQAGNLFICRIAVEIDSDTYLKFEKDEAAIRRNVLENIAACSKVYETEIDTRLVVTSIRIWKDTEPDPYQGYSDIAALLTRLTTTPAPAEAYDKRMYLYTKPVTGAGGLAHMSGVYSVSPFNGIETIMHELGHNFGSPHTHNCNWPGGPIDYCVGPESGCYDKSLEVLGNGTIMSYCLEKVTFHPLCRALMKTNAATMFQTIQQAPPQLVLSPAYATPKADFFVFPPATSATDYEVSYSPNSDFSGEVIKTLRLNGFSTQDLTVGTNYYLRIRASNAFGSSAWSEASRMEIIQKNVETPRILAPLGASMLINMGSPAQLTFTSATNVTGYQVQAAHTRDVSFDTPVFDQTVSGTTIDFTPPYRAAFRWRVRALRGSEKGNWSDISYVVVNASLYNGLYYPADAGVMPRSFPYFYSPIEKNSQVRLTIDDNSDFSSPIVVKEQELIGFFRDLPANASLYLKMEEWNSERQYYPDIPLASYIQPFSTTNQNIPAKITFLTELDGAVFGQNMRNQSLSANYFWFERPGLGYVRMNPVTFAYQIFSRGTTDGLIGSGVTMNSMRADKDQKIHFLCAGPFGSTRRVDPLNEDLTGTSSVLTVWDPIQDFNPDGKLLWNGNIIYRDQGTSLSIHGSVPVYQSISQIKVLGTKVWTLIGDANENVNKLIVTDLNDGSVNQTFSFATNSNIKKIIQQIEVGTDGKIWLRQSDPDTGINSLASFDGSNWQLYDYTNSALSNNISSLALSPSGKPYVLETGGESRVYKLSNTSWVDMGISLPYPSFNGDMVVDKFENIWLSNVYGIQRIASEASLPVTLLNFNAVPESRSVTLNWEVADETDLEKYVVEHSTNGKKFVPIGEIAAENKDFYSLVHLQPIDGKNYYRLKSVETDGSYAYSRIVFASLSNDNEFVFYPNPTNGELTLKIKPGLIGIPAKMEVLDEAGKIILKSESKSLRANEFMNLSSLRDGRYLIRIENDQEKIVRPIQLIR